MSDAHTVFDPFIGVDVEVSCKLVDRLRGKYACGPHLPNGNPEFGWRQFHAPPIQHEAADKIEALEAEITRLRAEIEAARSEEREFCALLAEQHTGMWDNATAGAIATNIRKRSYDRVDRVVVTKAFYDEAIRARASIPPADGGGE